MMPPLLRSIVISATPAPAAGDDGSSIIWRICAAIIVALLAVLAYRLLLQLVHKFAGHARLNAAAIALAERALLWVIVVVGGAAALQSLGVLDNAWAAITGLLALVGIGFVAVWSIL